MNEPAPVTPKMIHSVVFVTLPTDRDAEKTFPIFKKPVEVLFWECILVDNLKNELTSNRQVTSEEAQNHSKEFVL